MALDTDKPETGGIAADRLLTTLQDVAAERPDVRVVIGRPND